MTKKKRIIKDLIWVYPPHNWISNFRRTFVYGWSNPKARLFVNNTKIKICPNGNFAQVVKLSKKKNIVRLIQILNGKGKILTRRVIARSPHASLGVNSATKQSHKREKVRRLLRQPFRLPRNDMTIVIDPGHGGKEHGTHSPKGIPEKHFNLQIAKLFYKKNLAMGRDGETARRRKIKVYLTRTKDKFVSLKQRINFAKKKKCNLLISIHHNALPDNEDPLKHRGIGIYYTHDFVKPLAKRLLNSISQESKLKKYGVFKRNFALTRPDFCYAVLIECGFLIHPAESEIITQRKIQEKIVRGIIKGLV